MYNESFWEKYKITRSSWLFFKQYSDTTLFKLSSPLSSVFWISSAVVNGLNLGTPLIFWVLILLAVVSYLGPATYYFIQYSPFNVRVEWDPIEDNAMDVRAKHRGRLFLGNSNESRARVRVYFDESVDEYALKLHADGPLSAYPKDSPPASNFDGDENILENYNVDNRKFYFILKVESDGQDLGFGLDPSIKIKDHLNGEQTLLKIGIS